MRRETQTERDSRRETTLNKPNRSWTRPLHFAGLYGDGINLIPSADRASPARGAVCCPSSSPFSLLHPHRSLACDWPARLGAVADWRLPARAPEFKEGAGTRCPAALQSPPGSPVPAAAALAASLSISSIPEPAAREGREGKPREGSVQAGSGGTVRAGRAVWTSLRPPW